MKNFLFSMFLFLSLSTFGQSVPNTNTFSLTDATTITGGTSLSAAFTNSTDSYFDPTYKGSKDRLSNFRNYGGFYQSAEICDYFTKNDCPAGYAGSTEYVCNSYGAYTSWTSQADADTQASDDLYSFWGQYYANYIGSCTQSCTDLFMYEESTVSGGGGAPYVNSCGDFNINWQFYSKPYPYSYSATIVIRTNGVKTFEQSLSHDSSGVIDSGNIGPIASNQNVWLTLIKL